MGFKPFDITYLINFSSTFFSFRLSDEGGLAVNFNIHMDPAKGETSATEITEIIQQEILSSNITGNICLYGCNR